MRKQHTVPNIAFRVLLGLSLACPATGFANSREDIQQYFEKSGEYNTQYSRLLKLNATFRPDSSFLESQIPLKRESFQRAETAYNNLFGQLTDLEQELDQIPRDRHAENDIIEHNESSIAQAVNEARATPDFGPSDEINPETLQTKANHYQELVNQKQQEIDHKRAEISSVKKDDSYSSDIRERSSLESELSTSRRRVSTLGSENSNLTRQIETERGSLVTWRRIQRQTSHQITNISSNVLPPLRSEEDQLASDFREKDQAQRDLVFRLQRVEGNLRSLRNDEQAQARVVRRLRGQQQEARQRLDRINETLGAIPGHRREVQDINGRLRNVIERIRALRTEIDQKNGALSQAQQRKGALVAERSQLVNEKSRLQNQIQNTKNQLANLRKQRKNLENSDQEIRQIRQQIQAKRQQNQQLRGNIKELGTQRDQLRKRRDNLTQQINRITDELEDAEGNTRKQLQKKRKRLVSQRKEVNQSLKRLNSQIKAHQQTIAANRAQIERMRGQIAELEKSKERLREINRQIASLKDRKSNLENRLAGVNQQIAQKRQQIEQVNGRIANLNRELQPLRNQIQQANQRRQNLNNRKSQLEEIIARQPQLEQRRRQVRDNMANRDREVRRESTELDRIRGDVETAERRLRRLRVALSEVDREKDALARELRDVRSEIARNEAQLSQLISRRDEAIRGEARSEQFIRSAQGTIAENRQGIQNLEIRIGQIEAALPPIVARIEAFEEQYVQPLERELAGLLQTQRSYQRTRDRLLGWKTVLVNAAEAIEEALQKIAQLEIRKADLESAKPALVARTGGAKQQMDLAQADLLSTQTQLTELTNEFTNIRGDVLQRSAELKTLVREIRRTSDTNPDSAIVLGETSISSNESFEKNEELSSKDWETGIIANHKLTGETACVAFTSLSDESGVEVARLEVYAPMQTLLDESSVYAEPTIQLVTSSSELFFLDGGLKTNRTNRVNMAYALNVSSEAPEQGALLDLGEKDFMVTRLRADRTATVTLADDAGEIVEFEFSLSGSSRTIRNAYAECGLK